MNNLKKCMISLLILTVSGYRTNMCSSATGGTEQPETTIYLTPGVIDDYLRQGNINAADSEGNTLLMNAIKDYKYEAIKYLLDHGANTWAQNKAGQSVLDIVNQAFRGSENRDRVIAAIKKRQAGQSSAGTGTPESSGAGQESAVTLSAASPAQSSGAVN